MASPSPAPPMMATPTMAKAATRMILRVDTQKEIFPNTLASRKFIPNSITANITIQSAVEVPGKISFIIIADATIWAVMVAAAPTQFTQPTVKPMAGPINSVV